MLTAEELCDICGTTLAQRAAWAKEGDLRQQRGFEELDAVELATYARLRETAGPKRAKAAWRDHRSALQELLLKPPRRLWIVIETKGIEGHTLATSPAHLARVAEHGRPVVVVDIRHVVEGTRAAYRDAASRKHQAEVAGVRQMRSAS